MDGGDITQRIWEDIKRYCKNYSRDNVNKGRGVYSNSLKNGGDGVSKMDLSNFLSEFKKDIINNVATQSDTMQAKRKHEEVDAMLVELCSHY